MPRKESTPDAPTVNANEAQANVSILPNGESTKLEINFTNKRRPNNYSYRNKRRTKLDPR